MPLKDYIALSVWLAWLIPARNAKSGGQKVLFIEIQGH